MNLRTGRAEGRDGDPSLEEVEDATVEGDVPYEPGTARTAFAHPEFRTIWLGAFASNIGRWMQNVVLGAFAFRLTESPVFVSLVYFAQLGPMLLLSIVGGVLADAMDRRRLLIVAQAQQLAFSLVLAAIVAGDTVSKPAMLAAVFAIGVGQAIHAPAWSAMLPTLVGRRDLGAAISLNSAQMNASRVIGPAIGGVVYPLIGAAGVFLVNGISYVFVIGALFAVRLPATVADTSGPQGLRRLRAGFDEARRNPVARRVLVTIATFAFFCLPFIGQMPTLAERNLGMDTKSLAYGLLYAAFGLGAVTGAVSIGTFLARAHRPRVVRRGLSMFAVSLTVFALSRAPALAYPAALFTGFFYFATVTSLSTILQEHLEDRVRGRVMSLWIMGFGGTVPIGLMVAGPVIEVTSITAVVLAGAAVATGLAWYARLDPAIAASRRSPSAGMA